MSSVHPFGARTRSRSSSLAFVTALALAGFVNAQVGSNYVFSQSAGTYVPITGGTLLGAATGYSGAASLDDVYYPITLPFTFTFDNTPITDIIASTNGFITLGTTTGSSYGPLSASTAWDGVVSAFGRDLQGGYMFAADRLLGSDQMTNVSLLGPVQVGDGLYGSGIPTGTTVLAITGNTITMSNTATSSSTAGYVTAWGPWSEMRYETLGTAPNQVFVVQWSNFKRYSYSTLTTNQHLKLNFQIRLIQASGEMEVVYGDCDPGLTTYTTGAQVGLRGPTNTFPGDVNNRMNTKGVNDDWQNSDPGTANSSSMVFNNVAPANVIPNGLTYRWAPPVGAYAGFSADFTRGPSPLVVQFTDQSWTTEPTGILSWDWDLDGDGVTDSTLQNPMFVYANCGSYDVSLTVSDGINPPNTLQQIGYIVTDLIQADFTAQVIGPLTVQFTDTSNMPALSWAWDLDGDGVTDSTAQNAVWVYPNTNAVDVTLTVARLCQPVSSITKSIVPLQTISHNVAQNNGLSSGASVYFDVDITNPFGIDISAMDVFGSVYNVPFTIDMYVKPGTHRTFEGTAAEWVLAGSASGTSASANTIPSYAAFPQALHLPPGQFGIKLQYLGTGPRYQNLAATTTVANGDLSLTVGVSRGSTLTDPWAGSNIDLRAWSGTLYYGTLNVTGLGGYGAFAPGCAGSMGVSHLWANLPQLGSTFNLTFDNLPTSAAIMVIGFNNTVSSFGPLPIDMTPFGAPGCIARVSDFGTAVLVGSANTASWSFAIPAWPGISGIPIYVQAFVPDPGFNALTGVMSDAAALQLGL